MTHLKGPRSVVLAVNLGEVQSERREGGGGAPGGFTELKKKRQEEKQ